MLLPDFTYVAIKLVPLLITLTGLRVGGKVQDSVRILLLAAGNALVNIL